MPETLVIVAVVAVAVVGIVRHFRRLLFGKGEKTACGHCRGSCAAKPRVLSSSNKTDDHNTDE